MLTSDERVLGPGHAARMGKLVERWLARVPLYRGAGYPTPGERPGWLTAEGFQALPFITKADIRRGFPNNFLPAGTDLDALLEEDAVEVEHTSGTLEARTSLLLARGWWAEQERRALRLNGVVARVLDEFPEARRVVICSPVCSNDICYTSVPDVHERTLGNARHLSLSRQPLLWNDAELARMAAEAVEWQPLFLDVDPVYGMCFARYCEREGIRLPSLRFIICSYEFVSVTHRRVLERVFGVPVFNLYGSTETGHLLMENERGEMTPVLETAHLEVVETDANGVGDLVVTTLTNDYMPLVRYRIGDLVERRAEAGRMVYAVHGRSGDAFALPDGGRVTPRQVDEVFAGVAGIAHYQLAQQADGGWLLLYVRDGGGPSAAELAELRRGLERRLGIARGLELQETEFLLGESSGKFRLDYPAKAV
jgi:phenylacetate-CoA ligase